MAPNPKLLRADRLATGGILAILTALTLRAVFRLALRQTEGLIGSIIHRATPENG